MSMLQRVQVGSDLFQPTRMFQTGFQQIGGNTSFTAFPASMGIPVQVLGTNAANPIALFDNRKTRAANVGFMFAVTAANNLNVKFEIATHSKIDNSGAPGAGLYLRTQRFLGSAAAAAIDLSATGQASAFGCDHFDVKTFADFSVRYVEPTDATTMAQIFIDSIGADYITVRLAQGSATAAFVQVYSGIC